MDDLMPPTPDEQDQSACAAHGGRGFFAGLLLGIVGAGLLCVASGFTTPAAEAAFGVFGRQRHDNPCDEHDEHGRDQNRPPTAAEARDHAEFFVAFTLHRLQANLQQQESVLKTFDSTVDQALPLVEKHRANRKALHEILGAKTIDRDAIEKLRVDEVAIADSLSRTLAKSLGDTAEALTPEQRQQFFDEVDQFQQRP